MTIHPQVLFQDEYILVLEKEAGLVVTPTETQHEITLTEVLQKDFKITLDRGGIVHRLDKNTSGIIIVAKTEGALDKLKAQFQQREVKKEYLALVHGFLETPGKIDAPIDRNPGDREKFTVLAGGREAQTEYKPEKILVMSSQSIEKIFEGFSKIQLRKLRTMNYERFTLISCFPLTGRTHQIRVHLKYIGFPIVSDEKYGGRKVVRLDKRWCPRQFLHATRIEFSHPENGKKLNFESKLPEDLEKALNNLEPMN